MPAVFQPTVSLNTAIFNACDALCILAGTERPVSGFDNLSQIEKKGCAAIVALQIGGVIPTPASIQAMINASIATFAMTLAVVAYSGDYNDLINLPVIPAAATAQTLQVGSVNFVAGQRKYLVSFSALMTTIPKIKTQVFMADDNGETMFSNITIDSLTQSGFAFWLSAAPTASSGRLEYTAKVESTPP